MLKKSLFYTVYKFNKLEKDIEAIASLDTLKELCTYFEVSKQYLSSKGLKKQNNIKKIIKIKNKYYLITIDSE